MCKHSRWIVETSTAPIAEGRCTECGRIKMFPNQIALAATPQSNVRKDITLVGSGNPTEYFHRIAESFARDL